MSTERSFAVRIPQGEADDVRRLQVSAAAALARHRSAPIGDLTEAVRYEQIQTAITNIAFTELGRVLAGHPSSPLSDITVELSWPFALGTASSTGTGLGPKPVARVFRSELVHPDRQQAAGERFRRQLQRAVRVASGQDEGPIEPVCPNEMPDRALSEALRDFFKKQTGEQPVEVPVVYRDGSVARPLRLRSLPLTNTLPGDGRQVLRVTLLSVRHLAMDIEVDGAWLRNREISLPRPTGQTDELVYQQSQRQLDVLAAKAPIELHLYQTGLPPAIMGFYRALADHHLDKRGHPVAVLPKYYEGPEPYSDGPVWVTA